MPGGTIRGARGELIVLVPSIDEPNPKALLADEFCVPAFVLENVPVPKFAIVDVFG